MAYAYCQGCDAPLTTPSLGEAVTGSMDCPACHKAYALDSLEAMMALDDIESRIKVIEDKLGITEE